MSILKLVKSSTTKSGILQRSYNKIRCQACNVILTTQEATRKFKVSGDFVDLCNKCLSTIDDDVTYCKGNHEDEEVDEE